MSLITDLRSFEKNTYNHPTVISHCELLYKFYKMDVSKGNVKNNNTNFKVKRNNSYKDNADNYINNNNNTNTNSNITTNNNNNSKSSSSIGKGNGSEATYNLEPALEELSLKHFEKIVSPILSSRRKLLHRARISLQTSNSYSPSGNNVQQHNDTWHFPLIGQFMLLYTGQVWYISIFFLQKLIILHN
jgi:hypothetical protein